MVLRLRELTNRGLEVRLCVCKSVCGDRYVEILDGCCGRSDNHINSRSKDGA
jgi:hypothetical protein